MLSYKQWKSLNESILPSFNLGLGGPSKIGLVMQNSFDTEEGEIAEAKKGKKHPKVEVEVKDEEKEDGKPSCGKMCGKNCGKMCGKMSKKKMWSDEDDNYEDEDEDMEDEDEDMDDEEDEDMEDEDEDMDDEDDEDEDDEDEDMEDEGEESAEMQFSKKSKKKMLKGKQKKLDINKNGKIDSEDLKMLRKKKMGSDSVQRQIDYHKEIGSDGMKNPRGPQKSAATGKAGVDKSVEFHSGRNMKKKMKREEAEWWDSVNSMISESGPKMSKKKKMGSDSIQKQIDYHKEIGSDGMPDPKAGGAAKKEFRGGNAWQHPYGKNMKKKMKSEETEWWNSVESMISNPNEKFDDGFGGIFNNQNFTPIDVDNLTIAIREPAPGEVGFAPSGKIATAFGMDLTEAAKWTYYGRDGAPGGDGVALRGEDGKPKVFDTLLKAHDATETHGGKAVKKADGWIVVKMLKVPNQEDLKKVGSFRSGEYEMPKYKGEKEDTRRTVGQDKRAGKYSKNTGFINKSSDSKERKKLES
jgi:hypothetical protein